MPSSEEQVMTPKDYMSRIMRSNLGIGGDEGLVCGRIADMGPKEWKVRGREGGERARRGKAMHTELKDGMRERKRGAETCIKIAG